MIASVDYTTRFCGSNDDTAWVLDPALLDDFSQLYNQLKETGRVRERDLLDSLHRIFVTLNVQATNDPEKCFLRELFEDLRSMLVHHIDFYSVVAATNAAQGDRAAQLCSKGFFVTEISAASLDMIHREAAPLLEVLRANARLGRVSRTDLSINSGRNIRRIVRVLNREFAVSGILSDVHAILRRRPRVVGLALEISVPGSTWWKLPTAENAWPMTLYAHVDRAVDAPKAIVYLSNVGPTNGPTSCYPAAYQHVNKNPLQDLIGRCLETIGQDLNSPLRTYYKLSGQPLQNERFRSHFMRLPPELRFNSHFGWDVVPGSQLEDFLVRSEIHVLGAAGTVFVFDGAELLHRGGLITEGERVVLQVVFGDPKLSQRVVRVLRYFAKKIKWA